MRNIEFKARLLDLAAARHACREVGAVRVDLLEQRDTYFEIANGRLKRREAEGQLTEWIEYHRANSTSATPSDYEVFTTREAATRYDLSSLTPWVVVDKVRELYLVGQTRIHLDRVHDLGDFLEFEALVNEEQNQAQAEAALASLQASFKPVLGPVLSESYSDLRLQRKSAS